MLRGVPVQQEPKLKNRFELQFPQELDIPSYLVQTSGRPELEIEPIKTGYMNGYHYSQGKYNWGTIEVKFIDLIGPSTSQKLMEFVRLHTESLTGRQGYAAGFKKDIIINTLDPTGVTIEVWKLYECMIINAKFDENTYDEGAILMPTLTLQPAYCELSY